MPQNKSLCEVSFFATLRKTDTVPPYARKETADF